MPESTEMRTSPAAKEVTGDPVSNSKGHNGDRSRNDGKNAAKDEKVEDGDKEMRVTSSHRDRHRGRSESRSGDRSLSRSRSRPTKKSKSKHSTSERSKHSKRSRHSKSMERSRHSKHSKHSKSRKRSRSRSRSKSRTRGPKSIRELRAERDREKESKKERKSKDKNKHKHKHSSSSKKEESENKVVELSNVVAGINSEIKKKSLFDIPPDPNVPPAIAVVNSGERLTAFGGPVSVFNTANIIAPKFAKSVYVGGIDPSSTNEKDLYDFFNDAINRCSGKQLNAVTSMYINKVKCFGFLEVNDYNLATAIIQRLNGIEYRGTSLSLRRPTNYDATKAPPQGKLPDMDVTKVGLKAGKPSTYVENTPDKIYIAGIPFNITDEQLQELLESFGPLEAMCVVRERGYAFCQYKDRSVTEVACEGLNGMQIGSQSLVVKRADINSKFMAQNGVGIMPGVNMGLGLPGFGLAPDQLGLGIQPLAMPGTNHIAGLSAAGNYIVAGNAQNAVVQEFGGIGVNQAALKPSKILVLKNMVTEEELRDDNEYKEILEDVRNECSNYGRVLNVIIPRPNESYHVPGLGKIFAEFELEVDAVQAKTNLEGRTFGARKVMCEFLEEAKFKRREF